jgi:uncharacterized protein
MKHRHTGRWGWIWRWLRMARSLLLILCLTGLAVVFYGFKLEPNWVQVVSVPVAIAQLAPEFQDYRIVQISDVHVDEWMTQQRLQDIVGLINRQKPDLVAITGDFTTSYPEPFVPTLVASLQQLRPKDSTVAVLGNHDHWGNPAMVEQALTQAGVSVLSNKVTTIQRGKAKLAIAGVDDVWEGKDDLAAVLQALPATSTNILLVHEPDFADISAATGQFALELSGHSHGGQVSIPGFGQPKLPPYGIKYPSGQYQVQTMVHYTNRGIGMVRPRVRFNARPEITLFTLKAG